MVPKTKHVKCAFADVFTFSRSAKDVGGDFYDVVELDDGGMGIALVKNIASGLSYQRSAGHNVLTLEFELEDTLR